MPRFVTPRFAVLFILALLGTGTHRLAQATQITVAANFDGGYSYGTVDAYPGKPGDGWAEAWLELRDDLADAPYTNFVVRTLGDSGYNDPYAPLVPGTDNYLYVDANLSKNAVGYGVVGRNYTGPGGIDLTQPYTISFLYRVDESAAALASTFTNSSDRYQIYDFPTMNGGSTAGCGWLIGAYGGNATWLNPSDVGYWTFYNGLGTAGDTGFYATRQVNTGIQLQAGQTLNFQLTIHPDTKTWDATVTDYNNPSTSFNRNGMGWRIDSSAGTGNPNATLSGMNQFSGAGNAANDERQFSLDCLTITGAQISNELPTADGFRGIWYAIGDPGNYKYSGGMATYPQQIAPHAFYSEAVDKTFFVYGGTDATNSTLYHMVSYFDHQTGQVARPRILMDRHSTNAHDNPAIAIDDQGYIFVFSSSHSTSQASYLSRSTEPYSIDAFEQVAAIPAGYDGNFSYGQPLFLQSEGFLFLHTIFTDQGRALVYNTSSDGINWDHDWAARPQIVRLPGGQYQISETFGQKVGTAFNYHPDNNVDARTNLYYMQTTNMGATWTAVDGTLLTTPVTTVTNAALVHDYQSEGLLVYLKDVQYDDAGNPILFYLTTTDYMPGAGGEPRTFHTAHWNGTSWVIKDAFTTDHNYDFGPLYVEEDGAWRVIAPTDPGPEVLSTGGEMEMWISEDEGDTWQKTRQLTHGSDNNHTYARQPRNADEGFFAFWADGDALSPSDSQLYFTDWLGTGVWKLPEYMEGDFATPEFIGESLGAPGPGDANGDGQVNAADARILAENWLKSTHAIWSDGDFNRDGRVDDLDASILAANWTGTTESGSANVPEPSLLVLLLSAGMLGGIRHRKKLPTRRGA
ncbi:MAG: BNR-4 repeat-containing protein [Pirellulales bacterium]|nr:BNR-4 repeat-containing protein [Pirellulales bacterium]